mgnify:CR=1 FL=1
MENKFKILVVDDSSVMRKGIIEILNTHIQADFIEARDGNDALEQYKAEQPDLVTLDINMPVCDGMTTLGNIMAFDRNAKIIMLTTEAEKDKIIKAVEMGAKSYIVKPINKDKAIEKIKNVLEL